MSAPSDTALVLRPLVCFGLVLVAGLGGLVGTKNGFAFIGFLLAYVPSALIVSVVGAVFAVKAYRLLPAAHKGRHILTAVMSLAVLAVLGMLLLMAHLEHTLARP